MNKKTIILIIILVLAIAGGVFCWWQKSKKISTTKEVGVQQTQEQTQDEKIIVGEEGKNSTITQTTMTGGRLIPPSGVSPELFEIVGLTEVTTPDSTGIFSGKIYEEGVTIVGAMLKGKEFGLVSVVIASDGEPETPLMINSMSTAVGLIFATPFLMTNEPQEAREILKTIESDPKVQILAQVIDNVFNSEEDFLDNPTYQQASKEAMESVLSTLNP